MIGLIIIGDEILSGRRQDKHLSKSIELLGDRGLSVSWARYVGDEPPLITAELKRAIDREDVVFCFGGIGATPDDHTRSCAAQALGVSLRLHPEAEQLILDRCRVLDEEAARVFDPHNPDHQRRLQMGFFPEGARIIPNPYNQIPGFSLCGRLHFLPGFPVMAWPMMAWVLDHWHADMHGKGAKHERAVVVYGTHEATLTPLMQALEAAHPGIKVFSLPSVDHPVHGRHIELGVKGHDRADVDHAFDALRQGLRQNGASVGPELVQKAAGNN